MKGLVISDTGPLISLVAIHQFPLLKKLFSEIFLPEAVAQELASHNDFSPTQEQWKEIREMTAKISRPNYLREEVDFGESEAIILYQETDAKYLLIDDKEAREYAESLQVKCLGTIGILVNAKKKGLVSELRPLFLQLLEAKRYFGKLLLNKILADYGENPL